MHLYEQNCKFAIRRKDWQIAVLPFIEVYITSLMEVYITLNFLL